VYTDKLEDFDPLAVDTEDSLRNETLNRDGEEIEWHSDIFTYEDCIEIEMLYIFQDPEDEIFNSISGPKIFYEFKQTGDNIYPVIESMGDETRVAAFLPVPSSTEHEIYEFPSAYLDQIRDELYDQVISENIGS
jgi:hypothetical protein